MKRLDKTAFPCVAGGTDKTEGRYLDTDVATSAAALLPSGQDTESFKHFMRHFPKSVIPGERPGKHT